MREIFIGERCVENRRYGYYLLAESGEHDWEHYGVKIDGGGDGAVLRGITVSQRDIQALGALLVNGSVTPVTLRDVVEDWLARD